MSLVDVRTMVAVFIAGSLVSLVLLLADLGRRATQRIDLLLAGGRLAQLIGWTLIFLRDSIPVSESYSLGNSVLFAGLALESYCLVSLKHRHRRLPLWPWGLALGIALPFLWLEPRGLPPNLFVILAGIPALAIYAAAAGALMLKRPRCRLHAAIGLLCLAYPVAILVRDWGLAAGPAYRLFAPGLGQDLTLLGFFTSSCAGLAGYLLIKNDLAARDLAALHEASIAEKDTSMRELKHRVKNNLNIVASLLELESGRLADEVDRGILLDTEARIQALSAMYDKLWNEGGDQVVSLPHYIGGLADSLRAGILGRHLDLELEVRVEDLSLDSRRAVPLGLIVNEALTNALKYGLAARGSGRLEVTLARGREGRALLEVRDDGPGLPAGFDPATSGGLGMNLMSALAGQLGGSFHLHSEGGTKVVVDFPLA